METSPTVVAAMKSPSPNMTVTKEGEDSLGDVFPPTITISNDTLSCQKEIEFELSNKDGRSWKSHDLNELWKSVIGELQAARSKLDLPFVPFCG